MSDKERQFFNWLMGELHQNRTGVPRSLLNRRACEAGFGPKYLARFIPECGAEEFFVDGEPWYRIIQ